MAILSATKTAKVTLQKRRNLFGLGITSLIAACSTDGADNDATPTPIVPEELTTRDVNNAGITATVSAIYPSTDNNPTRNTASTANINNIGILINLKDSPGGAYSIGNNQVLEGTKTVTFHIENGNHEREVGSSSAVKNVTLSLYEIAGAGKYDLVVSSPDFGNIAGDELTGGVYIYWDIQGPINSALDVANPASNPIKVNFTNHLEVKGLAGNGAIAQDAPAFFQLGGSSSAQYDMVVRSNVAADTGAIYILWDVAAYAGADKDAAPVTVDFAGANDADINATHGLLAIKGASAGDNIGANLPDILKINNNNDYDMIIKADAGIYILWDIAKYYSKNAPAEISLTDVSAVNGLLTISGGGAFNILKNPDGVFLDIDGNGINDIVLTDGNEDSTFILFGEKVADRDTKGKAVSHAVDIAGPDGPDFGSTGAGFFTADAVTTVAADAIGYRFAEIKTFAEVQADFPDPSSSPLSDTDAGVAVWDIA